MKIALQIPIIIEQLLNSACERIIKKYEIF